MKNRVKMQAFTPLEGREELVFDVNGGMVEEGGFSIRVLLPLGHSFEDVDVDVSDGDRGWFPLEEVEQYFN